MKLMIVILTDRNCEPVLKALTTAAYRVTRIDSTGGFLRRGNITLLIGTTPDLVEGAIELIRESACDPDMPDQRRATIFVVNADHYEQV